MAQATGETAVAVKMQIDWSLKRPGNNTIEFRRKFCSHFHITTSGNFSDTALRCAMMEIGADRIMFADDWPFVSNLSGTDWIRQMPLSDDDRVKIMSVNAERLFGIGVAADR